MAGSMTRFNVRPKAMLPMQTRLAAVGSIDLETRTAEVIWSTGAQVRRLDFWSGKRYVEELSLDPKHVHLERLNSGAPLLNVHGVYELGDVIGVVESASTNGKEGRAKVRFSKREEADVIFREVQDHIIRNVSVGYTVRKYEITEREGELPIYRAVDWEPAEISLVPIGADPAASVRLHAKQLRDLGAYEQAELVRNAIAGSCEFIPAPDDPDEPASAAAGNQRKEQAMPEGTQVETVATPPANVTEIEWQAAERARAEERTRIADIRTIARVGRMDDAWAQRLIDSGASVDDARRAYFEHQAKRYEQNPTRGPSDIIATRDETDTRRALMSEAIAHRANPENALSEGARHYRGMDLLDMARECIAAAGGKVRSFSRREIAVIALNLDSDLASRAGMHSTSDFPAILGSTVNRTLRAAYQLAPRTFVGWCRRTTAPDFREVARAQLSELSKLQKVNEGGEYKYLSFGDSQEKYSLAKYGGIVAITWETLVNDDLSAFDRISMAMADEAAATEGDIVYGILTSNPNMADGNALFSSAHGNLAGAGAAISDTSLGAARAAMRKQTGAQGRILNITPDVLIVGPDKEAEANKYTSAQFVAAKASDINPNFNTTLEVVVDARISGNQWFMATRPTRVDTIEYTYLEGEEEIFTEQRTGFEVDGLETKVRHVFAAKAIDWRGLYKNPGA